MLRRAANLAFWLGFSLYFGGMVTLALAAGAVFRTTRSAHINLPNIAAPLDPASQAGGEIFGAILEQFAYVEVAALGFMLVGIAGFLFSWVPGRRSSWILLSLWLLLAVCLGYDAAVLRPAVVSRRAEVRSVASGHGDTNFPAHVEFEKLHKRSENLGKVKIFLLLGMLPIAAWAGVERTRGRP